MNSTCLPAPYVRQVMYNSSSGSKLNMGYRKNQRELAEASEEDSEESDEESEEEQLPLPKPKRKSTARLKTKPTTKGRGQSPSSFGGKAPKTAAPVTMDMTGESSEEETQAPPLKKPRKGKSAKKGKAKAKKSRRTLRISESPSKVKLGSTVVANSSLSQQQHTLSVAAMLRKKIAEFQVTTRPLFTYLLSESTAHRSLPVVIM